MLHLTVRSNAKDVARGLRAATRELGLRTAPPGALEIIKREGLKFIRRHFQESRSPEGKRWDRLKRPRKRGSRAAAKPLVDHGRLRDSVDYQPTPGGGKFFSSVEYAAIHNYGGTINVPAHTIRPKQAGGVLAFRWKGRLRFFKSVEHPGATIQMPQREFMGLGRAEQTAIAGELDSWLTRSLASGGLRVKRGGG